MIKSYAVFLDHKLKINAFCVERMMTSMNFSQSPCYFGVPLDESYQVSFEITNKCNLHCVHCMNKSEDGENVDIGLSWEKMEILIDEMIDNNVKEIYLSGGEPTLYPHFEKLVKKTKNAGLATLIATNAYDIESSIEIIKKYVDIVFVSIDGTEDTHDLFRGQPGAFSKSICNIKKLISFGIPVRISTVVSKNNLNELEKIIKIVSELGVFQIHFTVLVNVGRAKTGDQLINNDEYRNIMNVIFSLKEKYAKKGFIITTRRDGILNEHTSPCYGGKKMMHITSSGIIAPCSYIAKCPLSDQYCIKWMPGNFKKCLEKIGTFQRLCEERRNYFGHSSCAALASIASSNNEPLSPDPLDLIYC